MRRALIAALVIVVIGCGGPEAEPDPRLCPNCDELARIERRGGDEREWKAEILAKRDEAIIHKMDLQPILGQQGPLHYDCPGCAAAYDLILRAKAARR